MNGCDCLEVLRWKLAKHHSASDIDFDLKMSIEMDTFEMKPAIPPLVYRYSQNGKKKKGYIVFSFCPFCGRKSE
jgi:hypothetical protein